MIAAAGSGKTTFLVKEALGVEDKNVLITTYTEANEAEIKKNIIEETKGYVPKNITIQTWFSFLLQHGVRPYQSAMNEELWLNRNWCDTEPRQPESVWSIKSICYTNHC
jgi:ATP-dependent DNA helicase UvrD/PcrA